MTTQAVSKAIGKERPLIAVIGSTQPTQGYSPLHGIGVGYALRGYMEKRSGTIFTGGVDGVGVDVYAGVIKYCLEQSKAGAKIADDRFFALVPQYSFIPAKRLFSFTEEQQATPFQLPRTYSMLALMTDKGKIDLVTGGTDLAERRRVLAETADIIITLNGSAGTLDEASMALRLGKPVITLPHTRGAATILHMLRDPSFELPQELEVVGAGLDLVDKKLILSASNTTEMLGHLASLLR
jgi:hypothetical protein